LLLIGDYEPGDPVPQATRQMIESDPHIICTGHICDLADHYQVMDVLALPTYREGFPSVVLEAQSAGKPVVTTTATGAIDSIEHGVTGLLVPIANVPALTHALRSILRDRKYAVRLGAAGRARVLRDFGHLLLWNRLVEEYQHVMIRNGYAAHGTLYPQRAVADSHLLR
jgi:glycosyltransferase involved in cell wall biosynthesis